MNNSPPSRGKGNRQPPGRPGGARKKKPAGAWQHRAQHMVEAVAELSQPVVPIDYNGVFREKAEHNIYLFDQEMARRGIWYFAVYHGRISRIIRFTIYVPEKHAPDVVSVAAKLRVM